MAGRVIPPNACLATPPHIEQYNGAYMVDYIEDVVERTNDTRPHPMVKYMGKYKLVEEAREENPYVVPKDQGIDYMFWNEFHSNFYASVIFNSKKSKIMKMQYVDWQELEAKHDPEFDKASSLVTGLASLT